MHLQPLLQQPSLAQQGRLWLLWPRPNSRLPCRGWWPQLQSPRLQLQRPRPLTAALSKTLRRDWRPPRPNPRTDVRRRPRPLTRPWHGPATSPHPQATATTATPTAVPATATVKRCPGLRTVRLRLRWLAATRPWARQRPRPPIASPSPICLRRLPGLTATSPCSLRRPRPPMVRPNPICLRLRPQWLAPGPRALRRPRPPIPRALRRPRPPMASPSPICHCLRLPRQLTP